MSCSYTANGVLIRAAAGEVWEVSRIILRFYSVAQTTHALHEGWCFPLLGKIIEQKANVPSLSYEPCESSCRTKVGCVLHSIIDLLEC